MFCFFFFYNFSNLRGCGATEATGLGFVCFDVINTRVRSANRVNLGFFFSPILLPSPPQVIQTLTLIRSLVDDLTTSMDKVDPRLVLVAPDHWKFIPKFLNVSFQYYIFNKDWSEPNRVNELNAEGRFILCHQKWLELILGYVPKQLNISP